MAMKRGGKVKGKKKAVKKRGGGMMAKKKMAKGGRLTRADIERIMPKGRSAAAKKASGTSKLLASRRGMMMKGKGNPAGKDMSIKGKLKNLKFPRTKGKIK